jgi:hypothetical protein
MIEMYETTGLRGRSKLWQRIQSLVEAVDKLVSSYSSSDYVQLGVDVLYLLLNTDVRMLKIVHRDRRSMAWREPSMTAGSLRLASDLLEPSYLMHNLDPGDTHNAGLSPRGSLS